MRSIIAHAILACTLGTSSVAAQATAPSIVPDVLYRRAWRMVHENYVDKKFGGQDWLRWEHRYDGKLKTVDDANKAIETMLASLGKPGADFMPRQRFEDESSQIEASQFGIGAVLRRSIDKQVIVGAADEGSAAADAGLHTGDQITEVDGKGVSGMSADQINHLIRGPYGTKVAISWTHDGHTQKSLLHRGESPVINVKTDDQIMDNVAYIRLIDLMTGQAARQMKQAVQDCKSRGGLILDLRDNHGGSLAYVIEVANYFLKPGLPVVTTVDSESYKQTEYSKSSADSGIIVDAPMVVLINRETASGAEMLASALKDNHRATIIGERSAGATAVKSIDRLEDGSGMNVTIARWLTSSGKDLSDKGLNPDLNIRLNKSELAAGEGPWWRQEGVLLPNTKQLKDAQLLKAMEEIKKKMVK